MRLRRSRPPCRACLRRVETRRHGMSRSLGCDRHVLGAANDARAAVARDGRRTKLRAKPPGQEPPHSNGMHRGTRTLPRASRPAKAVFCSCSCSCELATRGQPGSLLLPPVPRHCKPVKISVRFAFVPSPFLCRDFPDPRGPETNVAVALRWHATCCRCRGEHGGAKKGPERRKTSSRRRDPPVPQLISTSSLLRAELRGARLLRCALQSGLGGVG